MLANTCRPSRKVKNGHRRIFEAGKTARQKVDPGAVQRKNFDAKKGKIYGFASKELAG